MYADILLAADEGASGDAAVAHAVGLASAFDATVHLVYVIEPIPVYTRAAGPAVLENDVMAEARDAEARGLLAAVAERMAEAGVETTMAVRRGTIPRQVARYAAEAGVDLIIVGGRGRASIGDRLLGSTAEKVVRATTVPVLAVS